MDEPDLDVLKSCAGWLAAGRACELVIVSRTWGSGPRPPGSLLAIRDDGAVVGSVSGGCIEDDLIDRVRREGMRRLLPERVSYGIDDTRAQRFGLPCGGKLELVIEPLGERSAISELLGRVLNGECVMRRLDLYTGEVAICPATPAQMVGIEGHMLTTVHGPRRRLLIIGAGQLSRIVARIAPTLGYRVAICDPREEYHRDWDLPDAELSTAMPDDFIIAAQPDVHTAIVALTHDPKLDDMALLEALRSDAFYIGALGSRSNNDKRRVRLLQLGLTEQHVARLHGPVGLPIGSRIPAEIAISLLAELTAVKNGVSLPAPTGAVVMRS